MFEFLPPFQFSIYSQGGATIVYGLRHGVDIMSTNLVLVLPHGGVTVERCRRTSFTFSSCGNAVNSGKREERSTLYVYISHAPTHNLIP